MTKKLIFLIFSLVFIVSSIIGFKTLAQDETMDTTNSTINSTTSTTTTIPLVIKPLIKGINTEDLKQSLSIQEKNGWRLGQVGSSSKDNVVIYIKAGKVTEIGSNYVKVEIFGNIYKVILDNAKLYRQSWSISELDEFSVGDIINVNGYLDEDNVTISAINIRNLSLAKIQSSIKGVIKSIDPTNKTIVVETDKSEIITVQVDNDTNIIKFVATSTPSLNIGYIAGSFNDLVVNDLVIVRGIYNSNLKVINADVIIIGADERPYFKKIKPVIPETAQNQLKEIQKLIEQLKEQFRLKFK